MSSSRLAKPSLRAEVATLVSCNLRLDFAFPVARQRLQLGAGVAQFENSCHALRNRLHRFHLGLRERQPRFARGMPSRERDGSDDLAVGIHQRHAQECAHRRADGSPTSASTRLHLASSSTDATLTLKPVRT